MERGRSPGRRCDDAATKGDQQLRILIEYRAHDQPFVAAGGHHRSRVQQLTR